MLPMGRDRADIPDRDCEGDQYEVPRQPFAGWLARKPWGARWHSSLLSEYCRNLKYVLEKSYLLHSKIGLNSDAWLRRNGRTAA